MPPRPPLALDASLHRKHAAALLAGGRLDGISMLLFEIEQAPGVPFDDVVEVSSYVAALAHLQFETIHPFLDGNGRVGRLMIALILHDARVMRLLAEGRHPASMLRVFKALRQRTVTT